MKYGIYFFVFYYNKNLKKKREKHYLLFVGMENIIVRAGYIK